MHAEHVNVVITLAMPTTITNYNYSEVGFNSRFFFVTSCSKVPFSMHSLAMMT